jgi:hypothetical protein
VKSVRPCVWRSFSARESSTDPMLPGMQTDRGGLASIQKLVIEWRMGEDSMLRLLPLWFVLVAMQVSPGSAQDNACDPRASLPPTDLCMQKR